MMVFILFLVVREKYSVLATTLVNKAVSDLNLIPIRSVNFMSIHNVCSVEKIVSYLCIIYCDSNKHAF